MRRSPWEHWWTGSWNLDRTPAYVAFSAMTGMLSPYEFNPLDFDPLRDIVFILRTGALFPVYRTFSLLEQLKGRVHVPTVLFYPGDLDGAAGLRFMGVLDAEHNYRPKIF